jgi:hypothetical protein
MMKMMKTMKTMKNNGYFINFIKRGLMMKQVKHDA